MTDDNLKLIEARCMAASAGPWSLDPFAMYVFGRDNHMVAEIRGAGAENAGQRPEGQSELNARFIAYARADVPFLLAEVRRLQKEVLRQRDNADTAFNAGKRIGRSLCYSTEAVDALLAACEAVNLDKSDTDAIGCGFGPVLDAMEAVRASREPAK